MNLRQQPQITKIAAQETSDLKEALDALQEKQELVQEKLQEILINIEHTDPAEIKGQVLVLDQELYKYRRFFQILKSHFIFGNHPPSYNSI